MYPCIINYKVLGFPLVIVFSVINDANPIMKLRRKGGADSFTWLLGSHEKRIVLMIRPKRAGGGRRGVPYFQVCNTEAGANLYLELADMTPRH